MEAERKIEGAPLREDGSPTAIDQKRAPVREAEKRATMEDNEARDATEPLRPVRTTSAPSDRVAEIRRKQAEMLEKLSKQRA